MSSTTLEATAVASLDTLAWVTRQVHSALSGPDTAASRKALANSVTQFQVAKEFVDRIRAVEAYIGRGGTSQATRSGPHSSSVYMGVQGRGGGSSSRTEPYAPGTPPGVPPPPQGGSQGNSFPPYHFKRGGYSPGSGYMSL